MRRLQGTAELCGAGFGRVHLFQLGKASVTERHHPNNCRTACVHMHSYVANPGRAEKWYNLAVAFRLGCNSRTTASVLLLGYSLHQMQALSYAATVRSALEDYEIIMTGHSLGGPDFHVLSFISGRTERSQACWRLSRLPSWGSKR